PSLERSQKPRKNRKDANKVPENANTLWHPCFLQNSFDTDLPDCDFRSPIQLSICRLPVVWSCRFSAVRASPRTGGPQRRIRGTPTWTVPVLSHGRRFVRSQDATPHHRVQRSW